MSANPPNTIKFQRIQSQDGKDLNLFTSLYYHLTVKSIPNGIVTFESEPRDEGNLIELALNDLEDFEQISVQDGNKEVRMDGPLADQAMWTILPELSRKDYNEYQIKVLAHPEAKLTYTHGSSWGGRYMEIDLTNPESYNPRGNMYSSCLWTFHPTEFPDFYTIHNCDPRRDPNFMTFSNEPSQRGQLMQLGTKELEHYSKTGTFRQDALWQCRPRSFQLFGKITDFYFEEPTPAELGEEAYPISIGERTFEATDPESKIEFSTMLPESFKLNFMQSFKPFLEANVSIDSSFFDGRRQLQFLQGKRLNFVKKPGSNTQFQCLLDDVEHKIQEEFKFPEKEDKVDEVDEVENEPTVEKIRVKGYCNVVKELEIPFLATIQVRARADCADAENGEKVEGVQILATEVIEYLLKFEKFTGKVRKPPQIVKKKGSTAAGKPKGNLDSTENHGQEGVVYCDVSGRLKCTCGLDTWLDFKIIS